MASRTSNMSMAKSETVQRCAVMDVFAWNSHAKSHTERAPSSRRLAGLEEMPLIPRGGFAD